MRNGPYTLIVPPKEYPGKLYRGRYAYEHQVVWWLNKGELVGEDEVVHHVNEIKTDNRIENLEKKDKGRHISEHQAPAEMEILICGWCKNSFNKPSRDLRRRRRFAKTNLLFCSYSCGAKHQHENYESPTKRHPFIHGNINTYRKGCRCVECKKSNAEKKRNYLASKKSIPG